MYNVIEIRSKSYLEYISTSRLASKTGVFILKGTNIGHLFRRRQEAASVARRLSLEIEIAQISNKPKKTLNEIKYPETNTNSCDAEISRVEFSKTESPKPSIPKGENDLIS